MITFEAWPKTPRYSNTTVTITEKLDGTNACVIIRPTDNPRWDENDGAIVVLEHDGQHYAVGAQSRTRLIYPGKDNYGFAQWVNVNARMLVAELGEGRHFGEWWGSGIQRRYNMDRKIFSLFNTHRWDAHNAELAALGINLDVVPVLYQGRLSDTAIRDAIEELAFNGSEATRRYGVAFNKPEGVIIYSHAFGKSMKAFVENDDVPKGLQG